MNKLLLGLAGAALVAQTACVSVTKSRNGRVFLADNPQLDEQGFR